jgi:nucleotide-binding universal stress UspA family protein
MTSTILVGVDDRPGARDAVALGEALAVALRADLVVAHVYPLDPVAGSTAYGAAPDSPLAHEADEIIDRAVADIDHPFRRMAIPHLSTIGGLHQAAERVGAEAIVVGSTHRGTIGRIMLGSHAERLLHDAPCAVAVAPHGLADADWALRRITVAYDGSAEAQRALKAARRLAAATGASLHLVSVIDPRPSSFDRYNYRPEWQSYERHLRESTERSLEAVADGAKTETRVGDTVAELVTASSTTDLIVLGSRGYGPVRRVMVGATAQEVVRKAASPVVVVPRSAEGPEDEGEAARD